MLMKEDWRFVWVEFGVWFAPVMCQTVKQRESVVILD